MTKKKKIILIGATVALFLILLTGSYLFAKISNSLVPSKPELIPVTSDIFEKTEKQTKTLRELLSEEWANISIEVIIFFCYNYYDYFHEMHDNFVPLDNLRTRIKRFLFLSLQ